MKHTRPSKVTNYKDIPFAIRQCENCDMDLPEWEYLCPNCIILTKNKDILLHQYKMWKKYVTNKSENAIILGNSIAKQLL